MKVYHRLLMFSFVLFIFFKASLFILTTTAQHMKFHGVKRVQIRSYSGPHFSRIFPHSDWILRDTYSELFWSTFSPDFPAFGLNTERYRVSLRKSDENENQNNSEYRLFLRSVFRQKFLTKWLNEFIYLFVSNLFIVDNFR